jgi:hypothetical protein
MVIVDTTTVSRNTKITSHVSFARYRSECISTTLLNVYKMFIGLRNNSVESPVYNQSYQCHLVKRKELVNNPSAAHYHVINN